MAHTSELVDLDNIVDLVATVGLASFGRHFFALFASKLGADHCTVFAFKGESGPTPLIIEAREADYPALSPQLTSDYVSSGFAYDPNVSRQRSYASPTVHCLSADQLEDKPYRLRFYEQPRIAHELVVLGRMQDTLYYSSFYRAERQSGFDRDEMDFANYLAQFSIKALHKHWELRGGSACAAGTWLAGSNGAAFVPQQRSSALQHLTCLLLAEPYTLSRREAEVCAAIVLGQTTRDIGDAFGISVSTVANHRKRAYRKLGVCSQHELFSRYSQAVDRRS